MRDSQVHDAPAAERFTSQNQGLCGPKCFFALLDEMIFGRTLQHPHFLGFQIFWRKEKLLTYIRRTPWRFATAIISHLRQRSSQRFFATCVYRLRRVFVICACRLLGTAMVTISMSRSFNISRSRCTRADANFLASSAALPASEKRLPPLPRRCDDKIQHRS